MGPKYTVRSMFYNKAESIDFRRRTLPPLYQKRAWLWNKNRKCKQMHACKHNILIIRREIGKTCK